MFCRNCGADILDNAAICIKCGCLVERRSIPHFSYFSKSGISKSEETLPCPLTTNEVDSRMLNLSKYDVLFDLVGRNITDDGFEYSLTADIGLCSFGELIYVRCFATNHGTMVNIFSKCAFPLQLFAWGKHGRNIRKIKNVLGIQ